MKIFKGKYGFSVSAHSKNPDGTENKYYLDAQFKKGYEPLNDLEGDLLFVEKTGARHNCFVSSYRKKDGTVVPKLVVMPETEIYVEKNIQTSLTGNNRDVTGHLDKDIPIETEELPFY